jgi:hypothetical protein
MFIWYFFFIVICVSVVNNLFKMLCFYLRQLKDVTYYIYQIILYHYIKKIMFLCYFFKQILLFFKKNFGSKHPTRRMRHLRGHNPRMTIVYKINKPRKNLDIFLMKSLLMMTSYSCSRRAKIHSFYRTLVDVGRGLLTLKWKNIYWEKLEAVTQ